MDTTLPDLTTRSKRFRLHAPKFVPTPPVTLHARRCREARSHGDLKLI